MNEEFIMIDNLGKAWLPKFKLPKLNLNFLKPKPKPNAPKPPVQFQQFQQPTPYPKPVTSQVQQTAMDVASITPGVAELQKRGYRLLSTGSEFQAQQQYGKNAEEIKEKYDDVKLVRISDRPTKSGFVVAIMVKDKPVTVAIVNKPSGATETIVNPNPLKAMQLKFTALPKNQKIMVGGAVVLGIGAIVLVAVNSKGGKSGQ